MPEPVEKTPASGVDSRDVRELAAQLEAELRKGPSTGGGDPRAALRTQAEGLWTVSAERQLRRNPGVKSAFAYPVKRALRPFLRWYVEPLAAEQRAFNYTVLKLIDDLYERTR